MSDADAPAQQMMSAVAADDVPAVEALVRDEPDLVRLQGDLDKSFLHWAAELDSPGVARILVEAGSDLQATTQFGMTAFQWAAAIGSRRTADVLLAAGAEFDMWTAAGLGELGYVGSCFDAEGTWLRAPSLVLCGEKNGECAVSTERGHVVDAALHVACRNGHAAVARLLQRCGADPDALGYFRASALHWSALRGFLECVGALIEAGAQLEVRDTEFDATPLGWALRGGHAPVARALFNAGAGATHAQLTRLQELESAPA
jgi:uncharacterized protein